jgi:hypothetical protein
VATPAASAAQPTRIWPLWVGDALLGELRFALYETPWVTADFTAAAAFDQFKPYLQGAHALDQHLDDDDWDPPTTPQLDPLIAQVRTQGGLRTTVLGSDKKEAVTIHFNADYAYATFR